MPKQNKKFTKFKPEKKYTTSYLDERTEMPLSLYDRYYHNVNGVDYLVRELSMFNEEDSNLSEYEYNVEQETPRLSKVTVDNNADGGVSKAFSETTYHYTGKGGRLTRQIFSIDGIVRQTTRYFHDRNMLTITYGQPIKDESHINSIAPDKKPYYGESPIDSTFIDSLYGSVPGAIKSFGFDTYTCPHPTDPNAMVYRREDNDCIVMTITKKGTDGDIDEYKIVREVPSKITYSILYHNKMQTVIKAKRGNKIIRKFIKDSRHSNSNVVFYSIYSRPIIDDANFDIEGYEVDASKDKLKFLYKLMLIKTELAV